ncbi:MAG: magnesium chelatase subunit D, partial [Beijerinckiaceae bacterium]
MSAELRWEDACRAAELLALDAALPGGFRLGGAVVRGPVGEARRLWLTLLPAGGEVRVGADVSDMQLLGGIDLEQTLASGKPVAAEGALARARGGRLTMAMAERLSPASAALVAVALDHGGFHGLALDEGIEADERPPASLIDRLGLMLDLSDVTHREAEEPPVPDIAAAMARYAGIEVSGQTIETLCALAAALGVGSLRAPLTALRAAQLSAALAGHDAVSDEDISLAARLVLAPRATRMPQMADDSAAEPPPPPETDAGDRGDNERDLPDGPADDRVVEATLAALPAEVLALAIENARRARSSGQGGKAGEAMASVMRGRPIGSRRGDIRGRQRIALLDTLRAAAPWQKLRRAADGSGRDGILRIRRDDIRIRRLRERRASTTIFVVDASGSTALDRLGEAKGAVELILADCYVRRDEVALIAFRGQGAELLLPATRALERAKRALASLPGGGGTPLAAGLAAADRLADEVRRKGRMPTIVIITDGRANVGRDGNGGRAQAQEDAEAAARLIGTRGLRSILIDNSARPEPKARSIADRMGAAYVPLPRMNAGGIAA